jgi:hypothetical protein
MGTQFRSILVLGTSLIVLGAACGTSGGGGQPDAGGALCTVSGVSLSGSSANIAPGGTVTLTATVNKTGSFCNGGVTWLVVPSSSGLTPSGTMATFTTATPGPYTITAISNDDTSQRPSFQVTVAAPAACGTPNGTVVTHSSNITADETWAGNGVTHSVTTSIRVMAPATLTIQPCAIVSVAKDAEIGVLGDTTGNHTAKLVAAGTDDTTGFVAFVPAVDGQPWGAIHGFNQLSLVELHHTELRQAGGSETFLANSAIGMIGPGIHVTTPTPVLLVDHVVIQKPVGGGVYLDSMAAFDPSSTVMSVVAPQNHPISIQIMAAGSIPQVVLSQLPAQKTPYIDAYILPAAPDISADTTINGHIPLYLEASVNVIDTGSNPNPLGVTLTMQAGAQLRFKPGANLRMIFGGRGNAPNNLVGRLIAVGNPTAPVSFTSAADVPAAGDWAGLQLATSDNSQMAFNIIEYAGGFSGVVSDNCRPAGSSDNAALIIGGPDYTPSGTTIVSSIIQFSAGHGIDATWQAGTPNDPNMADQATGNVFNNLSGCKQTYNGLIPGVGSCPQGGGCTEQ